MGNLPNSTTMNGSGDSGENVMAETCGLQPIDLNFSTSEESKGGMKYEVVIADAKIATPLKTAKAPSARPLSAEVIQRKIDAAAERRKSLETLRLASLSERFKKVQETTQKRKEELNNFVNSTKENLEQKIEVSSAKRETLISDIKTRLSNHSNHLQEVRQNMIESEEKAREEIANKLEIAEKKREKIIQEKLESLKKHDEKVELVRKRASTVANDEEEPSADGLPPNSPQ